MRLHKTPQLVEAVMFFTDDKVFKQLLLTEFEAVLDGVVSMPELADQEVRAAYVLISPRLLVRSLVFFYIDFDEQGGADAGWNIPLRYLAERAELGPDLGAGPIRLASRSQCPESSYQMHLWEPVVAQEHNYVLMVRDAVKANSLGLLFDDSQESLPLDQLTVVDEENWNSAAKVDAAKQAVDTARNLRQRLKAAQVIRKQRSRISSLENSHAEQLAQVRLQSQQAMDAQQQHSTELKQLLLKEQQHNAQLQQQLSSQSNALQELRAELQQQMQRSAQREQNFKSQLSELLAKHQQQATLVHQAELAQQLAAELELLKQQLKDEHAQHSGEQVLEHLAQQGVVFVANHPGAGHITIPLQDMAAYMQEPMAYVAKKCAVSEEQYTRWLAHYQKPVCSISFAKDKHCGLPIALEISPSRFIAGDTDRCAKHKRLS